MVMPVRIQCPHCDAVGQIMLPPGLSFVIGACPSCEEMVLVFCGQALPLDKEIVIEGTAEERHDHIMAVLSKFLDVCVNRMIREGGTPQGASFAPSDEGREEAPVQGETALESPHEPGRIGQEELDWFVTHELELIDDVDYFRSVFG